MDKLITAEEASQLTSTKLLTVTVPTTTSISHINATHSTTITNSSCIVKTSNISIVSTINNSSVSLMANVATQQHINTLASGLLVDTSSATNIVFTSALLDQHRQLQYTPTESSIQPAVVEVPDMDVNTLATLTDGMESFQRTNHIDMAENPSECINPEKESEHVLTSGTSLLAHNQQNNTMEGRNIHACMYVHT